MEGSTIQGSQCRWLSRCVTKIEKSTVLIAISVLRVAEDAIVPGCDKHRQLTSAAFSGVTRVAGRAQKQKKIRHQPPRC